MENKVEDEIKKRWEQEAKEKAECEAESQRPKKRVRAIEYDHMALEDEADGVFGFAAGSSSKTAAKGRGVAKKKKATGGRAAAGKARGKVTEIIEDEEDTVVELD